MPGETHRPTFWLLQLRYGREWPAAEKEEGAG